MAFICITITSQTIKTKCPNFCNRLSSITKSFKHRKQIFDHLGFTLKPHLVAGHLDLVAIWNWGEKLFPAATFVCCRFRWCVLGKTPNPHLLLTESQYEHSFVLVVRCLTESGALKTRWSLSPNVCLSCWWKNLVPVLLVPRIQILVLLEVGEPPWEDVTDYSCLLHLGMEAARSRGSRDSWPTSAKQGLKSPIQSSAVGGELWKWSRGGIDRVSGEALGIGESVVYWSWTKRQAA